MEQRHTLVRTKVYSRMAGLEEWVCQECGMRILTLDQAHAGFLVLNQDARIGPEQHVFARKPIVYDRDGNPVNTDFSRLAVAA